MTHELTWTGELARHAAYVAHARSPESQITAYQRVADAINRGIVIRREIGERNRAAVLAALADRRPRSRAEVDDIVQHAGLSRHGTRVALVTLVHERRVTASGATTNRTYRLA